MLFYFPSTQINTERQNKEEQRRQNNKVREIDIDSVQRKKMMSQLIQLSNLQCSMNELTLFFFCNFAFIDRDRFLQALFTKSRKNVENLVAL